MLQVNDLTIMRGPATLAEGLNITLNAGETLVLEGPNGSGKTSFLRALAGLLQPAGGTIAAPAFLWLSAQPVPPSLETPRQYLAFHAALCRHSQPEGVANPFGIETVLDTPFNRLSTGWRQRVKLSRLLLADTAKLWLLDEPSDGLDADATKTLLALINRHAQKGGMAVIASHQPQLWPGASTLRFRAETA